LQGWLSEANIDEDGFSMTDKGGLPMFLAQAAEPSSTFTTFDIFMVIFTILIAVGLIRLLMQRPRKNMFAIGFATVALLVFLIADFKMVGGW
jgi:hypothetical protein